MTSTSTSSQQPAASNQHAASDDGAHAEAIDGGLVCGAEGPAGHERAEDQWQGAWRGKQHGAPSSERDHRQRPQLAGSSEERGFEVAA